MATETEYCSGQNEEVRLVQVSGEAGKLLSRIECSQLGFSEDLHGPYGQRRSEFSPANSANTESFICRQVSVFYFSYPLQWCMLIIQLLANH